MKTSATNTSSGEGLVYRGPMVYRQQANGTLTLDGVSFWEGRITPAGVRYHVCDHLGSVKAVVDGSNGDIYTALDYDEYGAVSTSSAVTTVSAPAGETFRTRFTGQEDQGPVFGLPYTDFGARHYSPVLRRWMVPDPMNEKYYDISPYAYCANNPMNLVDPKGKVIVESSQKLWSKHKSRIEKKVTRIQNRLDRLSKWNITTGSFVHEITHAGQFESGDLAFSI